jgi:hypothetical protein
MRARTLVLAALLAMTAGAAPAQLIDDIETRSEQGVAELRLQFSLPVRYIRHFPEERGELVKIYLQAMSRDGLDPMDLQTYQRVPSVSGVPPFTLQYSTVRNCFAVPDPICLDVQFRQPVQFRIRPGEDGRSLILVVLPDGSNSNNSPKTGK